MRKVRLGELTSREAKEIFAENPVILLPAGSHETHGPQTPMGDYLVAEAISERIARAAWDQGVPTLVAPVLPFGGANYFGGVPGGMALSQGTLRLVLAEMAESFLRHGLNRLIFMNGHNGNVEPIHDVTLEIYRKTKITIPSFYIWAACGPILSRFLDAETIKKTRGHGSDPVTGVNWHLWPERMRPDYIPDPPPPPPDVLGLKVSGFGQVKFEGTDIWVPLEVDEIAPIGVWNCDPRLASRETGAKVVDGLTEIGSRFVVHFAQQIGKIQTEK